MILAESGLRCAATGLEVVTRPEWSYASARNGFEMSVAIIGGCLVSVRASGYADLNDVEESVRVTIAAIDSGITAQHYVHIADYSGLRGSSMRARRYFIEVMRSRQHLSALIFCGLSPLMRLGVRLGARFNAVRFQVLVERDFSRAARRAMAVLGLPMPDREGQTQLDHGDEAVTAGSGTTRRDPSWQLSLQGFRASFQVIDGDTLYSVSAGRLEEDHVDGIAELRHRVLEECGLERGFNYFIADVSSLEGGSRTARRLYMRSLRDWYDLYPFRALYFCGANRAIQAGGFLSRPFFPFTVGFAGDLDEALAKVRQNRKRAAQEYVPTAADIEDAANRRHAAELLRYLATLEWGNGAVEEPGGVPPSHPFFEVFEGIRLVFAELDEQHRTRQQIMEEVRRERLRLMTLVDNLPDGVVFVDEASRIVLVNQAAESSLALFDGHAPGEELKAVGGLSLSEIDTACEEAGWLELSTGEPQRLFLVSSRNVPGGGRAVVLRDVTSERNMRRQLEQQERLAAVGQLAAGVAHDFNNMLQAVGMMSEMLKAGDRSAETVRRCANEIAERCERGALLIRRILDFSRKSISRRRPMDLCACMGDMVRLLGRVIPENISIKLHRPPDPVRVQGDQAQIQQLVTNLAVNARDAMPAGGTLEMSIDCTQVLPDRRPPIAGMLPGEWIELRFTDTGCGIPAQHLPHIFEPFFTTRQGGVGSGLGLAQVYGIVRQHDGFVDVFSRTGQGTTVVVYLPQLAASRGEDGADSDEVVQQAQGETVLVVEDDEGVLQSVGMALEQAGFRVLTACDGAQALALFRDEHDAVSIVLSDVVMPRMGGMALAGELQRIEPGVRVILMSGYPLGEEADQPEASGNLAWIAKPFSATELIRLVHRVLARE